MRGPSVTCLLDHGNALMMSLAELQRRIDAGELSPDDAIALSFHGSPTILVDGSDPFPASGPPGLACRIYDTPDGPAGTPSEDQLRAALSRS